MKMIPVLSLSLLAMAGCNMTAPGTSRAPDQLAYVPAYAPLGYAPVLAPAPYSRTAAAPPIYSSVGTPIVYPPIAGQPVAISGEMQTSRRPVDGGNTVPQHDLVIRVNGQPAVAGTLVTYGTTTLEGRAGTMPVSTTCVSREIGHADRQFDCRVSLNGQPTSLLSFRATPFGPQPPVAPG